MRRLSIPVVSTLTALLAIALLGPGLGPASGAIPNPTDGRFYGCMVKATGLVKLINYPKVDGCPKGQKMIDWGRTGPQGPAGPQGGQGAQGAQGAEGAQGLQGVPGITKITITTVKSAGTAVANAQTGTAMVMCPVGSKVIGGGHSLIDGVKVYFFESIPTPDQRQWKVQALNESGATSTIYAYAICMTTEPSTVITKIAKKKGK